MSDLFLKVTAFILSLLHLNTPQLPCSLFLATLKFPAQGCAIFRIVIHSDFTHEHNLRARTNASLCSGVSQFFYPETKKT